MTFWVVLQKNKKANRTIGGFEMASYTQKELKEMSTERLIGILVINSSSTTKSSKQTEEKVFKELSDRKVIDYNTMKTEYERIGMW